MSLSIAMIFYYFATSYSFWLALYSLFIYLSSYMLWAYWAEARPYSLIVLVVTLQSLVFLKAVKNKGSLDQNWKMLAGIHLFMSLTFSFSVGLVLASSLLLWCTQDRDWKKYIFLTIIPVAISFYYLSIAPKFQLFTFCLTPEQLIRDNMSRDRLYLLAAFMFFFLLYGIQKKTQVINLFSSERLLKPVWFVWFTLLSVMFTLMVMWLISLKIEPTGHGVPIVSRHFIYLTPIGVIATVLISNAIVRSFSNYRWIQWAMIGAIALLVIPRFFKIAPKAIYSIMNSGNIFLGAWLI
jgi:hypothetical protein